MENKMLTAEQLRHYSESGFVKAEAMLPADFVGQLCIRLDEYALKKRVLPPGMTLVRIGNIGQCAVASNAMRFGSIGSYLADRTCTGRMPSCGG
jgi:hypothetical protein